MTDQKVHKCPECGAECRCERGNFNPKDCVHYECFTGIAEAEVTNPVTEQKELL